MVTAPQFFFPGQTQLLKASGQRLPAALSPQLVLIELLTSSSKVLPLSFPISILANAQAKCLPLLLLTLSTSNPSATPEGSVFKTNPAIPHPLHCPQPSPSHRRLRTDDILSAPILAPPGLIFISAARAILVTPESGHVPFCLKLSSNASFYAK